jgi:lauroyl/myristoyl acyltransferase
MTTEMPGAETTAPEAEAPPSIWRSRLSPAAWARYIYELCVLVPAARLLPRAWALALADASGYLQASLPNAGATAARCEVRAATGLAGIALWRATAARLAGPRRDIVLLRRLRALREHPRDWPLREVHGEGVHALAAAGKPFIIAAGHFYYAADLVIPVVLFPGIGGRGVKGAIPERRLDPEVLHERLLNRSLLGLRSRLVGDTHERFVPEVGRGSVMQAVQRVLAQPGGATRILIDAVWTKAGYDRPFAGTASRRFALGAARIARRAQCPIIFEMAVFEPDGGVRVEWGPYIDPPAPDDEAADVGVMDQLIDHLEACVARYPLQYLHPMGCDRRWDPASGRWQPR